MSTTLNVYAVPLDRLARVPGSKDGALARAVALGSRPFFDLIDQLRDRDPEEDPVPACSDALDRIIAGDLDGVPGHHGYLYGYALEALCAHLGQEQENISGIVGASGWIGEVDAFLAGVEVPARLGDLVFGGAPIRIPEPDDYPAIGRWPPELIARALGPLRGVYLDRADPETAGTVRRVRTWVEAAAARPGWGLVGFLS